MIGAITAAERHPDVVAASLDAALLPDGVTDRMANLKHMGYLPSPKGSSVNVNVNASANAAAVSKSDGLESSESTIRRIVEARQKAALPSQAPQLPAAVVEHVPMAFQPRGDREMVPIDADGTEDEE